MYFLSMMKLRNSGEQQIEDSQDEKEYRERVDRVSRKIDQWHNEMSIKKQGSFKQDCDFVEIGNSPSRFDTDVEDDEGLTLEPNPDFSKTNDLLKVPPFIVDSDNPTDNSGAPLDS